MNKLICSLISLLLIGCSSSFLKVQEEVPDEVKPESREKLEIPKTGDFIKVELSSEITDNYCGQSVESFFVSQMERGKDAGGEPLDNIIVGSAGYSCGQQVFYFSEIILKLKEGNSERLFSIVSQSPIQVYNLYMCGDGSYTTVGGFDRRLCEVEKDDL